MAGSGKPSPMVGRVAVADAGTAAAGGCETAPTRGCCSATLLRFVRGVERAAAAARAGPKVKLGGTGRGALALLGFAGFEGALEEGRAIGFTFDRRGPPLILWRGSSPLKSAPVGITAAIVQNLSVLAFEVGYNEQSVV